jgi:N-acetylmuramic acid 6-phosphate etherase
LREMVLTSAAPVRRLVFVEANGPVTETRATNADLDLLSALELAELMNREDATVPDAVGRSLEEAAAVVDAIVERLRAGGRLIYVGAGTSGDLARLDAAECEGTFSVDPGTGVALVAGTDATTSAERAAAEDNAEAGERAVRAAGVGAGDAVIAVSASGGTPFTLGAARAARDAGAFTAGLACNPGSPLAEVCDRTIEVVVGPEVVAGSTRLKAGTAQKLVLNMLSTISMIRLGRTYGGLMVDVLPANEKLRARVLNIVGEATGAPPEAVEAALAAADGEARVAIVSLVAGVDANTARERLAAANGNLRDALGQ